MMPCRERSPRAVIAYPLEAADHIVLGRRLDRRIGRFGRPGGCRLAKRYDGLCPRIRPVRHLRIWGTRHAGACLCGDHPQEPGIGISCGDHPGADTALRHAAAEPALYRRHAWQAAGRVGWAEEGRRDRGTQRFEQAAVVEDGRVAAPPPATFAAGQHGGLSISSFCANFSRRSARNRTIETNAAAMRGYPPAVAKTSRVAGNATAASIASINRSRDSHAAI